MVPISGSAGIQASVTPLKIRQGFSPHYFERTSSAAWSGVNSSFLTPLPAPANRARRLIRNCGEVTPHQFQRLAVLFGIHPGYAVAGDRHHLRVMRHRKRAVIRSLLGGDAIGDLFVFISGHQSPVNEIMGAVIWPVSHNACRGFITDSRQRC